MIQAVFSHLLPRSPWSLPRRRIRARALLAAVLAAPALAAAARAQCPDGTPAPCGTAGAARASVPAPGSIAILPFENRSPDSSDAYLAEALPEEIFSSVAGDAWESLGGARWRALYRVGLGDSTGARALLGAAQALADSGQPAVQKAVALAGAVLGRREAAIAALERLGKERPQDEVRCGPCTVLHQPRPLAAAAPPAPGRCARRSACPAAARGHPADGALVAGKVGRAVRAV